MRVLITGAAGFAGGYLARACTEDGDSVVGLSREDVDLRDADRVASVLREAAPDVVYHLAALSSVGRSWEEPGHTVQENVASAVNVLEALRLGAPSARVLWVSTCEVYGVSGELPISEDAPFQPANPYAVSKAAGEMLAAVYAEAHGLHIVRARPFNHAGPGQLPHFIVSSLAQQVAAARIAGASSVRIVTGSPDTRRDFTDVRDVVRAYRLLAMHASPGAYNVCTGESVSAAGQVALLGELAAPLVIEHEVDPDRVRAHEVMDLRGSRERISAELGWEPRISFRQTMMDTVEWWERQLGADG